MVIGKEKDAAKQGAKPLAGLAGVGVAACDPQIMGWEPVRGARLHPRLREDGHRSREGEPEGGAIALGTPSARPARCSR